MAADRWRRLELRHLAALCAVAREGSIAAAAAALGYSQSAVSQQIALLERVVGARLLERRAGRRASELTAVGHILSRHAEAIAVRLDAAQADLAAAVAGELSPLRIGAYQSVATRVLPALLRDFRDAWPRVEIHIDQEPGELELLRRVRTGELELCIVTLPAGDGPFACVEVLRDPYVLVAPAGSPLSRHARLPLAALRELSELPLVVFRSCSQQPLIEAHLRAAGVEPRTVFTTDDNAMAQSLVAAGVGLAIVPRLTMDTADPRTAVIELVGRLPPRILALVRHRHRSPTAAATAFVAAARRAFAQRRLAPSA
jgi:molybdate transport repressor ModE-like protein